MNTETLEALRASIQHWREIAEASGPDDANIGPDHCALCRLFFYTVGCEGCPVSARTGKSACRDTPYEAVSSAMDSWEENRSNTRLFGAFRVAARAELDFLISLLPPGK